MLLFTVVLAFIAMNLVAYLHARAFTRFGPPRSQLPKLATITTAQKIGVLLTGASHPRPENDIDPSIVELPFETVSIPSGELWLEAWRIPRNDARWRVVLFHGHGAAKCSLLREAKAFHDLGCECLLVDFRACGGSTGDVCTLGVFESEDVEAAARAARQLEPKLPLILFGQSMGSAAILRAAAHNNVHVDGLIVECPFDRLFTTVRHRFEIMGLPKFPMANLLVFWGGAQHGFAAFDHNPVAYAQRVTTPTLLMHGALDKLVHVNEVESIGAALTGPKTVEVFPEAGHESYLFRQPEKWTELVKRFLQSIS